MHNSLFLTAISFLDFLVAHVGRAYMRLILKLYFYVKSQNYSIDIVQITTNVPHEPGMPIAF